MQNRNRNARRKRRNNNRVLIILAVVLVAEAIALIKLLPTFLTGPQTAAGSPDPVAVASLATAPAVTHVPVLTDPPKVTEAPAPTAAPAAEAQAPAEATFPPIDETIAETASSPDEGAALTYVPLITRVETDEKVIAVTVDDCFQIRNLNKIVGYAENVGAKLTIFPIGTNLQRDEIGDILKHAVFDLGFEIENHTMNHARIFRMTQSEMAYEIWQQSQTLNQALGVNYEQHFLRMMGGDGDTDQRVNNYLSQLGYYGIAKWSVSGSNSTLKKSESQIAPGQVFLFHTTDKDTDVLKSFIPYAVKQGYRLVTLNELLGLAENRTSALQPADVPEPRAFTYDWRTIEQGEYTWVTVKLQDELRALGYLKIDGESTGYYGPQTVESVKSFQKDHGLPVTGEADEATQRAILGDHIDMG